MRIIHTIAVLGMLLFLGAGSAIAAQPLAGTQWYLVGFQSMDDTQGATDNPRPLAYTLSLGEDGRATLRIDCNRGQGPWSVQPAGDGRSGGFALGPLGTTRALCPDDRLGPMLVRDAPHVRGYRLADKRLHLSLMADGGIYTWAPLEQPSFDCARADTSATELICTDATLAALDRELSRLYARALKTPAMTQAERKTLMAMQRGWIKGRDDCWKATELRQCVMNSMLMRIHELRSLNAHVGAADDGISSGPFILDCNDPQQKASISYLATDPPLAYLQWNADGITMTATPSGSGSRYMGFAGTPVSLWTQGHEATLTRGDRPERTCQINPMEY